MKWFWICLFAFLGLLVLMLGLFRPDLLDAALMFTGAYLVALAYVVLVAGGAVLFVGGGLLAWWWYRRTTVESLRQRDGHYPIQRVRIKGGAVVFVDPNQLVGPAIKVDRNTGDIYEHEPAADWHIGALEALGFRQLQHKKVPTPSMRYGANADKRVEYESVILFELAKEQSE